MCRRARWRDVCIAVKRLVSVAVQTESQVLLSTRTSTEIVDGRHGRERREGTARESYLRGGTASCGDLGNAFCELPVKEAVITQSGRGGLVDGQVDRLPLAARVFYSQSQSQNTDCASYPGIRLQLSPPWISPAPTESMEKKTASGHGDLHAMIRLQARVVC